MAHSFMTPGARRARFALAAGLACVPVATALGANVPLTDPIPAPIPAGDVTVRLVQLADGLVSPVTGTFAPGDSKHLYVLDQPGRVWAVNLPDGDDEDDALLAPGKTLVADLTTRVVKTGLFGIGYDERGLLGLAFHPDYRRNGLLYTFTNEPVKGVADFTTLPPGTAADDQVVVTEWRSGRGDDDARAALPTFDPARSRTLLRVDKPQFNHNGGTVAFGPDKMLYISLGDGGAADDQGTGHLTGGNGQRLDAALGKILRIDPLGRTSANGQYGVPKSNPFFGKSGIPEIWAYGVRNPFRISFDSKTGALYAADVGQNSIEEVDVVRPGRNYGWPIKEGTFLFDNNGAGPGFVFANSLGQPPELTDPIAEYDHTDGAGSVRVAIIGGYVYRGERVQALRGRYVFGDYSGPIGRGGNGHVYYLDATGAIRELKFEGRTTLGEAVLGFATDGRGEMYLLTNATGLLTGTTGKVYRIEPVAAPEDDHDD
jgi:glucose/arabinose dehydrogenase